MNLCSYSLMNTDALSYIMNIYIYANYNENDIILLPFNLKTAHIRIFCVDPIKKRITGKQERGTRM